MRVRAMLSTIREYNRSARGIVASLDEIARESNNKNAEIGKSVKRYDGKAKRLVAQVSELPREEEHAAVGIELYHKAKAIDAKPAAVYKLNIPPEAKYDDFEVDTARIKDLIADMYYATDPKAFLAAAKEIRSCIKPKNVEIVGALPEGYNAHIIPDTETEGNFVSLKQSENDGYTKRLKKDVEDLTILLKFADTVGHEVFKGLDRMLKEVCEDNDKKVREATFKYNSLGNVIKKQMLQEKKDVLREIVDIDNLKHNYDLARHKIKEKYFGLKEWLAKLQREQRDYENQISSLERNEYVISEAAGKTNHKKAVMAAVKANIADLNDKITSINDSIQETSGLVKEADRDIKEIESEISALNNQSTAMHSEIEEIEKRRMGQINDLKQNLVCAINKAVEDSKEIQNLQKNIEHVVPALVEALNSVIDVKSDLLKKIEPPRYHSVYLVKLETNSGEKYYVIGKRQLKNSTWLEKMKKAVFGYVEPWKKDGNYIEEFTWKQLNQGLQPEKPLENILPKIADAVARNDGWVDEWKRDEIVAWLKGIDFRRNPYDYGCF
jgi:chromosome segregation ATPase